jgi:type I restriction enzyme M protein
VPCELRFFDRGKSSLPSPPAGERAGVRGPDTVLMLDARNIFRKVTRKINDFSPEQMKNLAVIVALSRNQKDRFLALVKEYFTAVCEESAVIAGKLDAFETTLSEVTKTLGEVSALVETSGAAEKEKKQGYDDARREMTDARASYESDRAKLVADCAAFGSKHGEALPAHNTAQHEARETFDPLAEACRDLVKQVDLLYKLTTRVVDAAADLSIEKDNNGGNGRSEAVNVRTLRRKVKQLDEVRKEAVEQLRQTAYFHRQIVWLQERFPEGEYQDVPGLVKLVTRKEIEAADWSLTPGRYVGVAPPEVDENFDFEQTMRDIHTELADLNEDAAELAARIQANFEGLGI